LAWDNSTGLRYFAIGSGDSGYSSLYSIVADGSACGQQSGLGGGYFYAAFTMAGDSVSPPPGSPVPEPGPLALVLSGLAAIGFSRLVRGLRARALDGTAAPDRGPEMSP
jgi:hypothetical protein